MKRGDFIKLSAGLAAIGPFLDACETKQPISGRIVGTAAATGHLLRDRSFKDPEQYESKKVVIVGGGVSGLSAARHLFKNGIEDIVILDLEEQAGGNAISGSNSVSKYPWGAHYVPLPNNNLTEYLSFLRDADVITGFNERGLPVYNEYYLVHDPEERLYINGKWQEGLVPNFGLIESDLDEFRKFFRVMKDFKQMKGNDGRDAFSIPVDTSSKDVALSALDQMTMREWMDQNHFSCEYIRWYVNYCTRDDYGTSYDTISAWAGIHYFAARKGEASNASYHDVLTWEQGNGFLVQELQKNIASKIKTQSMAVSVRKSEDGIKVSYYDVKTRTMQGILAQHCIIAVPQFVAARLLGDDTRRQLVKDNLHYAPWMVANLTVSDLHERSGQPASWDNVIYGSKSLGYVDATHQQLLQGRMKRNLTYYCPITDSAPEKDRMEAFGTTHSSWCEKIFNDLKVIHPDIREKTENVDIRLWGHAMVQPRPGIIHGDVRAKLAESIHNSIHFAHTDTAGVSIFEEGFYQGIDAAKKVINRI